MSRPQQLHRADAVLLPPAPLTPATPAPIWQRVWDALWYAVLPATCVGCDKPLGGNRIPFFCDDCRLQLVPLAGPQCPRCGTPFASSVTLQFSPGYVCGACRSDKPAYSRALSLYPYASPLRDAIHRFKYGRTLALGPLLGQMMVDSLGSARLAECAASIDLVMPVPLPPSRLREREYNQSLLLARSIAQAIGRPLDALSLVRVDGGAPQTSLTRRARVKNLRCAFAVQQAERLTGRRILLIDDVLTTGTTVNECAKALRKSGSGPVTVLTLARTLAATNRPAPTPPRSSPLRNLP